jgi:hypothetical protein
MKDKRRPTHLKIRLVVTPSQLNDLAEEPISIDDITKQSNTLVFTGALIE